MEVSDKLTNVMFRYEDLFNLLQQTDLFNLVSVIVVRRRET